VIDNEPRCAFCGRGGGLILLDVSRRDASWTHEQCARDAGWGEPSIVIPYDEEAEGRTEESTTQWSSPPGQQE
jgi:hypothetical protein